MSSAPRGRGRRRLRVSRAVNLRGRRSRLSQKRRLLPPQTPLRVPNARDVFVAPRPLSPSGGLNDGGAKDVFAIIILDNRGEAIGAAADTARDKWSRRRGDVLLQMVRHWPDRGSGARAAHCPPWSLRSSVRPPAPHLPHATNWASRTQPIPHPSARSSGDSDGDE